MKTRELYSVTGRLMRRRRGGEEERRRGARDQETGLQAAATE